MDEMFRQREQEMKERMESLKQREQAVSRREETLKCMREDKRRQEIYVDRGDKAEVSIEVRQEKITPLSQDRAVQFDSVNRDTESANVEKRFLFPKFTVCSGEDPKPKGEATYDEWKYEVNCTIKEGIYPEQNDSSGNKEIFAWSSKTCSFADWRKGNCK